MADDTVAILTAIASLRDHVDDRLEGVRDKIHEIDKRLGHLEQNCAPGARAPESGGNVVAAMVMLATTYPRVFLAIVLSLVSGYPIIETIKDAITQGTE